MELVKVAIKNFQSIKDEEVIKINNTITTIVGLNESGKSTLLKAIEKLNGSQIEKKEKNKDRKYKNEDSHIIGKFLITTEEIQRINKASGNIVVKLPENDIYIDVGVDDEDNKRFYELSIKDGKESKEFDMFEFLKESLIRVTNDIFDKNKINKEENFNETILKANENDIEQVYKTLIEQYKENPIYDKLLELTKELKSNLWIDLIPEFKIVMFSSTDILSDEVPIDNIKNNIQVNNLLKIADIDIDELIDNVNKDDNEELKTYEGTYKDNITKMFKKIFRQNDSDFNFQIRIDTKNNKILFYTFDKTSGTSPIPLKNRSDGFRWYFSIYITLYEYLQRKDNIKYILLFDEPNLYLNPSAQYDLLERVFKKEFKDDQIIYTTHNPYMIDTTNFSTIRIVEKTDCSRFYNTTVDYLKSHKQIKNEVDPMTPILTALNIDISNSLIMDRNKKALVVEGIEDVYVLKAMLQKLKYEDKLKNVNIIPCFGAGKIALMFGYLYGMGYDTYAMVDNDSDGINALKEIMGQDGENSIFYDKLHTYNLQLDESKAYLLENLFSKKDLNDNLIPKNTVLYRNFYDNVNSISFEKETLSNFKKLFDFIIDFMGGKNG